jgi:uncharacterized protein YbcI
VSGTIEREISPLTTISNALVRLHKEQFGRGPTHARAAFAGTDMLVCVLKDVMLPAEIKMAAMGDAQRVRETRLAFQEATRADFVAAVEQAVQRKVRSFGSAIDVGTDTVFECYEFEPSHAGGNGAGASG